MSPRIFYRPFKRKEIIVKDDMKMVLDSWLWHVKRVTEDFSGAIERLIGPNLNFGKIGV